MQFLLTTKASPSKRQIDFTPAALVIEARPLRVLDFDIENRPLSYLGSDFTTAEVTAVAWAWTDGPVTVRLLGETPLRTILEEFSAVYQQADVITGHYIRGHDLPMMNGALMECQMPVLAEKRTQDTKLDLVRSKGLSLSQENLSAMFRLDYAKQSMNQIQWRAANRLTPEGLALVRERVVADVRQHMELRQRLSELGYLAPPKLWKPGAAPVEAYTP